MVTGFDGVSHIGSEAGPPHDKGCAEMGDITKTVPPLSPPPSGDGFTRGHGGSPSVAEPGDFLSGSVPGDSSIEGCHDNGRVTDRMGSDLRGQSCERHLTIGADPCSHKLFGVNGSISSTETFFAAPQGQTCSVKVRQLHGGGVCKLSGGHTFVAATQIGSQDYSVEQLSAQVAVGDARSRSAEQRSGSHVKRKSCLGSGNFIPKLWLRCFRDMARLP